MQTTLKKLKNALSILREILAELDKDNKALIEDIANEKLTSSSLYVELPDPFRSGWSKSDLNSLEYCCLDSSPPSHKKLSYLRKILPSHISDSAIRSKLYRLGYKIKKGVICKA